ncbi:TOMM precursor leader peptide-binding protein [Klugiella xanthotipulae]|uniref:Thiazole/oxazole-forming peptide maturase SagD family component n=1 Tax=Klugiella xanthotipulae TaxID=244735 RepID=A0A543HYR0_9MICO|nr:YcaO-like family protein [Klugiella xanthotipulae]TQM63472.1 thiazole/oxazole-forming peptide maturase SagD family component [Klugiella xanthotipulae]
MKRKTDVLTRNPHYQFIDLSPDRGVAIVKNDVEVQQVHGAAAEILRWSGTLDAVAIADQTLFPLAEIYGTLAALESGRILVPEGLPPQSAGDTELERAQLQSELTHLSESLARGATPVRVVVLGDYLDTAAQGERQPGHPVVYVGSINQRFFMGPCATADTPDALANLTFWVKFNDRAHQMGGTRLPTSSGNGVVALPVAEIRRLVADELARYYAGEAPLTGSSLLAADGTCGRHFFQNALGAAPDDRGAADLPTPASIRIDLSAAHTDAVGRTVTPEEFLAAHRHLVSPLTGPVVSLERAVENSPEDPVQIFFSGHNWAVSDTKPEVLKRSLRSTSGGKGLTAAQAEAGAVGEALERLSAIAFGTERRVQRRFTDLENAIAPQRIQLFSERQFDERIERNAVANMYNWIPERFDPDALIDYTPIWSATEDSVAWLPTSACYFMFPSGALPAAAIDPVGKRFAKADSNGVAAGATAGDAAFQGMLELIERDAVAVWWYNRLHRPEIRIDDLGDAQLTRAQGWLNAHGRDLWLLDLTHDLGVPVVAAVSVSHHPVNGSDHIMLGFGAHTDPVLAARRAVSEVFQFYFSTPLAVRSGEVHNIPNLNDAMDWLVTQRLADHPHLQPDASAPSAPRDGDLRPNADSLIRLLTAVGLRPYFLDLTRPELGINVVRSIVPGLRSWWQRFAPGRLFSVPVSLGWQLSETDEGEVNPRAMFF